MLLIRLVIHLSATLVLGASIVLAQVPPGVYDQAVDEFNHQKYQEAEETLKAALREHPQDARAVGLMGVILDAQKRYAEAENYYRRAIELLPNSASLYNNLGNHYLQEGKLESARAAYLRVTAIDPADPNANSQLAQIFISEKKGGEALRYLSRLPKEDQATSPVQLLRAQGLKLAGHSPDAEALLLDLLKRSGGDPRAAYSVGMVFAEWKSYEKAERAFSQALSSAPTDFELLYNLGLSALGAHDLDRAGQAITAALKQRPDDVDCLLALARVEDELHRDDQAAAILFRAQRLARDRPEVLTFLGNVLDQLGLYRDAAAVYDQCVKMHPADHEARRERGYALARAAKLTEAFQDLNWYVERHPQDPLGWFELAVAESLQQKAQALAHLDKALELDPKMVAAHLARAVLLRQEGRAAQAVNDLEFVLARQPDDFHAWDELGEAYLATRRMPEALEAFQKSASLAPQNSEILWHYAHALMRAGQKTSAEAVLAKVQSLGHSKATGALPPTSSVLLNLTPSEPASTSLAALRELATANPQDWRVKIRLGKVLLSQGKASEALEVFQGIRDLIVEGDALGECGRALLAAGQYKPARGFLSQAVAAEPSDAETRFDLAIAVFHDLGPESALAELDKTPPDERKGDYYLLRAQLLDAMGRPQDAAEDLNRGIRSSPTRPDLYYQAALFLVKHDQVQQMVDFLAKADRIIPNDPHLWRTRAIGLAILHQNAQAAALLTQMEALWPEWYLPYLIHGVILILSHSARRGEAPAGNGHRSRGPSCDGLLPLGMGHHHCKS